MSNDEIANEIRAINKLCKTQHPNIVQVFEYGTLRKDGAFYFIDMERCDVSLDKYIQGQYVDGLTNWETVQESDLREMYVYEILQHILHGILYIHALHEVHRDLSPHNGLSRIIEMLIAVLWHGGYWKIADFGLTSEATTTRLVASRYSRGRPCYSAPEFLRDEHRGYNNKSDIWSLGCIAYELFTGQKAFRNDYAVVDYARLKKTQQEFCKGLNPVPKFYIQELLRVDPEDRPSAKILFHQKFRFEAPVSPNKRPLQNRDSVNSGIDSRSTVVLEWAISREVFDVIKTVLHEMVSDKNRTYFDWVTSTNNMEGVKLLLREPETHLGSFHTALWRADWHFMKWLAEEQKGWVDEISSGGRTVLHEAAITGNAEVVTLLLDAKANINIQDRGGKTALLWAAEKGHKEVVKILLDAKASVNIPGEGGDTPLAQAVLNGHKEIVKMLLDAKADVEIRDSQGCTALMHAVALTPDAARTEIAMMLVDAKADVNIQNINSLSALAWAASLGHKDCVKMLLDVKAHVDVQDSKGDTALTFAANHGYTEIAKILLAAKADVDIQTTSGSTALMFAANRGDREFVEILLDAKVNVDIQNSLGFTAFVYATQNGHTEIANLLQSHGKLPSGGLMTGLEEGPDVSWNIVEQRIFIIMVVFLVFIWWWSISFVISEEFSRI